MIEHLSHSIHQNQSINCNNQQYDPKQGSRNVNENINFIICEELEHSPSFTRKNKNDLKINRLIKANDIKINNKKLLNPNYSLNRSISITNNQMSKNITTTNPNPQINQKKRHYVNMDYEQNQLYKSGNNQLFKPAQNEDIKQSIIKDNHHRNYHYSNDKQKQMIIVEKIKSINLPQAKDNTYLNKNNQKKYKYEQNQRHQNKFRDKQMQNFQQLSRNSESKPDKTAINPQMLYKQNSHHFLERNPFLLDKNVSAYSPAQQLGSKIQEKLHLPSLNQNNSSIKKGRLHQNISSLNTDPINQHRHYDYSPQILNESMAPLTHKLVKIPIQRLKPLKPQQIKLKYQKKIKQQQRNRAKDIAIHIFNREEQDQLNLNNNLDINEQIDRVKYDQNNIPFSLDSRIKKDTKDGKKNNLNIFTSQNPEKNENQHIPYQIEYTIKKTQLQNHNISNGKSQNIFKKQLLMYNS